MTIKEVEKVLEELHEVRPEKLNEQTRRLFDAIMFIADERDYYKNIVKKAYNYVKKNSYIVNDKQIDGIDVMSLRLDKCADLIDIFEGIYDDSETDV